MKTKLKEKLLLIFNDVYALVSDGSFDFVVILGDLLDNFSRIDLFSYLEIEKFILNLAKFTKVYIIIGNHDMPSNDLFMTSEHAFNSFKEIKNITVADKTTQNDEFLFIPFIPTGRFAEALAGINLKEIKYIFCHQEFNGAKTTKFVSTEGDPIVSGIQIIAGHFHDYQELENLTYVGSLTRISVDECDEKFMLLVDNDIKTKIPVRKDEKVKLYLDVEEFRTFVAEKDKKYEITVTGDRCELKEILKNNKDNVSIVPKIKKIRKEQICKKNNNFEEIFAGMMESEELSKFFESLYMKPLAPKKITLEFILPPRRK